MATRIKIVTIILLSVSLILNFATTIKAQGPTFIFSSCRSDTGAPNSSFQTSLDTLFSSLSSNATVTEFYNTTVPGRNPSDDTVYGLFMCSGYFTSCGQCVVNAMQRLSLDKCSLSKAGLIWYDECMVRYSNTSFFSKVDNFPEAILWNVANISTNQESFMKLLFRTMNETAEEAANSPVLEKKYATKQANISDFQNLYCMAQCTEDLSPQECRTCLSQAIGEIPSCCYGKQGGRVLLPSCFIRYDVYPFYRSSSSALPGPADSKDTEDPVYISTNCSALAVDNSYLFQSRLRTLLINLSSVAASGKLFSKKEVEGTVYGLFMCRGDLPHTLCSQCVRNAGDKISSDCGSSSNEAIIWYSHCLLRYSIKESILSEVETSPRYVNLNVINSITDPSQKQSVYFTSSNILFDVAKQVADVDNQNRYATNKSELNPSQWLYTLAQCTANLSPDNCKGCLYAVIASINGNLNSAIVTGRVLTPSCNIRFEFFQFYRDALANPPPSPKDQPSLLSHPSDYRENGKGRSPTIILIVVPSLVSVILLCFGCYLLRTKRRMSNKNVLKANFGDESATLEPLQFGLAVIKAATNNFSIENRIGKGGFGEVFKGILLDGRQIAVKRLSTSSKQGEQEFKNEILLIARLQHRNLVAFIGFCLEKQERILIYEYVLNKSLDYLLFDAKQQMLSWFDRYSIIGGVARGILYLHEYSRLKVIHRDLKPSNILLDENLNPKISDFGMARSVEINQEQGNTNRIVGTHGYMSPEYAMLGQFSEKSDVFSFGIMILEIITGKKNASSYKSYYTYDGLMSYIWRQWSDNTPLSILDPNIKDNFSEIEVNKCIQIGLLCVQQDPDARPTMAAIVSYLSSSDPVELPIPEQPAFFMDRRMDQGAAAQESSSSQSIRNTAAFSKNEISMTSFVPR